MARRHLILAFLLACTLIVPPTTMGTQSMDPAPDPRGLPLTVPFNLTLEEPSGVLVYHFTNPDGLRYSGDVYQRVDLRVSNPIHAALIHANGTILSRAPLGDGSSPQWGTGEGVVYAGAGPYLLQSPDVREEKHNHTPPWGSTLFTTEVWMVVTWANQAAPVRIYSNWTEGTTIEYVANGTISYHEMKNLNEGVRLGAPAATRAHILDGVTFDPQGGQLFGYISWYKTDYWGIGNLTLEWEGIHRELDLTKIPDPDDECFCYSSGRWLYTSSDPVRVGMNYIGDGRNSDVYVLAAMLPDGSVPDGAWGDLIYQQDGRAT